MGKALQGEFGFSGRLSVGLYALHRAEPGAGGDGDASARLSLVELWLKRASRQEWRGLGAA